MISALTYYCRLTKQEQNISVPSMWPLLAKSDLKVILVVGCWVNRLVTEWLICQKVRQVMWQYFLHIRVFRGLSGQDYQTILVLS